MNHTIAVLLTVLIAIASTSFAVYLVLLCGCQLNFPQPAWDTERVVGAIMLVLFGAGLTIAAIVIMRGWNGEEQ